MKMANLMRGSRFETFHFQARSVKWARLLRGPGRPLRRSLDSAAGVPKPAPDWSSRLERILNGRGQPNPYAG